LLLGEWRDKADKHAPDAAVVAAHRAMALDPTDAFVIAVAAHVEAFLRQQPESAVEMFDRSLLANKNSAFAWGLSAVTCCYLGKPDAALERLRNAWRLSPFDPMAFFFWGVAGLAELLAQRNDQALVWLLKAHRDHPGHFACIRNLCICHALMGHADEARALAGNLLARDPSFRISEFAARYPLRRAADLALLVEGLRAAGLPE
jgi:adenylate cyclase